MSRKLIAVLAALIVSFFLMVAAPTQVLGQTCSAGETCVPPEDMKVFVKVLEEKKCLLTEEPKIVIDPITVITDKDGRVFYSGGMPHPFKVSLDWCDYKVDAQGTVKLDVAMAVPDVWGFRFRPKVYAGFTVAEPFIQSGLDLSDTVDVGVLFDFLYYDWVNLNAAVGYGSFGGGVGFDITDNAGVYVGYGLTWGDWNHTPVLAVAFGF